MIENLGKFIEFERIRNAVIDWKVMHVCIAARLGEDEVRKGYWIPTQAEVQKAADAVGAEAFAKMRDAMTPKEEIDYRIEWQRRFGE